eukprot:1158487-Pelagomonas_calceolata.AAC.12
MHHWKDHWEEAYARFYVRCVCQAPLFGKYSYAIISNFSYLLLSQLLLTFMIVSCCLSYPPFHAQPSGMNHFCTAVRNGHSRSSELWVASTKHTFIQVLSFYAAQL